MTLNDLLTIQAGRETSWASAVPATVQLLGLDSFNLLPLVESELKPDLRATQVPAYAAVINKIAARADFAGQWLYEDSCYWLEGLMGIVTPTGSGPYTRTYTAPQSNSGVASPRLFTLYKGDNTDAYRMVGGLVSELTFNAASDGIGQVSGKLLGQQVQGGAVLASLADRSVNVVMGDHLALYLDAWGGTLGATPLTASSFAYTLHIDTRRRLRHFLNARTPGAWLDSRWSATLALRLAFNASTKPVLDNLLAGTLQQQQIRLEAINGLGASARLDFTGTLLTSPKLYDDESNQSTLHLTYAATYHPTFANWFKARVVNNLSALP